MNTGRSLLSQILTYIPKYQLDKIIENIKVTTRLRSLVVGNNMYVWFLLN